MVGAKVVVGSIKIWKISTNCVSISYTVINLDLIASYFAGFLVAKFVFSQSPLPLSPLVATKRRASDIELGLQRLIKRGQL